MPNTGSPFAARPCFAFPPANLAAGLQALRRERDADCFGRVFMDAGIDLRETAMDRTRDIFRRLVITMTPDRDDRS